MTLAVLATLYLFNILCIVQAVNRWHLIAKEVNFLSMSIQRLTPEVLEDFFKYIESVRPLLKLSYEWLATFRRKIIRLNKGTGQVNAIYRSLESFSQIIAESSAQKRIFHVPFAIISLNVAAVALVLLARHFQHIPTFSSAAIINFSLSIGVFSTIQIFLLKVTVYRLKSSFIPCFARIQQFCPLFDTRISQVATLEISKVQTDYLEKIAENVSASNALLQAINAKLAKPSVNQVQSSYLPLVPESVLDIGKLPERPRVHLERKNMSPGSDSNQNMKANINPSMPRNPASSRDPRNQ